jgi:hypothetical protein
MACTTMERSIYEHQNKSCKKTNHPQHQPTGSHDKLEPSGDQLELIQRSGLATSTRSPQQTECPTPRTQERKHRPTQSGDRLRIRSRHWTSLWWPDPPCLPLP